jgi:hypothetical protein
MAALEGATALLGALAVLLIATAAGEKLLRWLGFIPQRAFFQIALSTGVGVVALEAGFFGAQLIRPPWFACAVVLLIVGAVGSTQFLPVIRVIADLLRSLLRSSALERTLAGGTFLVLAWLGTAAVAPLTGSDALHYHFAWPLLVVRDGFHPDLSLAHSLLTGQGHALIFAGLAFGSEKLALALLFCGGALAAVTGAAVARERIQRPLSWLVVLAFLLTPVVFWQISSAGAPDLWMSFFTLLLASCLAEAQKDCPPGLAVVCGILAGGIAGAKYTGCILAAVAFAYFIFRARSLRRGALFVVSALAAGVWPYFRNLVWTGDPVFPFASRWLHSVPFNAYALHAIREDTGAAAHRSIVHLFEFPFFASIDPAHLGFWQFFGPLCLLFLPFFLLAKRTRLWSSILVLVIVGGLLIAASSGMARFLLPVFPLALAGSFAGCAALWQRSGRLNRALITASVSGFFALGLGGMLLYTRPAVAASLGLVPREQYLQERAPDFELSEFANQSLANASHDARVLVFMRHVYYLRVPYVLGDPNAGWLVNPAYLADSQSWLRFFHDEHIGFVLRAPNYPPALAKALSDLEAAGALVPIAQREVTSFIGNRLADVRKTSEAVILAVKQ